ncbi:MAG: 16S rRNA (adenine(1518)-N(6)/adenine(1519)-N(6))-dimethyltransferase RsmA [Minisyncoccia bacterium]
MRAKKSLGQHFLKSERALGKIVEAGELKSGDAVLEIGPGMGALTQKMLETGARVTAVEKDDGLFGFLKNKFEKEIVEKKLTLTHADILDLEISYSLLPAPYYKLISNIPYNITGAILEKFLSTKYQPERMVLLVQKEVAERIVAKDGKESILSLSVKVYGKPRYVETVKAGSFAPRPKVDSAIIAIENISKEFFRKFPEKEFFALLKAGFKSKRKKLSSNLSNLFGKSEINEIFKKLGIGKNARAEDLNLDLWQKLAENLEKMENKKNLTSE